MTNDRKDLKRLFLMGFHPVAAACVITVKQLSGCGFESRWSHLMDIPLWQPFLRILDMFDSLFKRIWIDKACYLLEGIYFPNNGCRGNMKKVNFSVVIATIAIRKKSLTWMR